jgi:hypothetical protein
MGKSIKPQPYPGAGNFAKSSGGTLKVMLLFEPKIKLAALLLAHRAHRHPPYHIGFSTLRLLLHGGVLKNPPPNV